MSVLTFHILSKKLTQEFKEKYPNEPVLLELLNRFGYNCDTNEDMEYDAQVMAEVMSILKQLQKSAKD